MRGYYDDEYQIKAYILPTHTNLWSTTIRLYVGHGSLQKHTAENHEAYLFTSKTQ